MPFDSYRPSTHAETPVPSAARTASGATAALAGYGRAGSVVAQLNVTAASGTTPSLTVKIQHSLDGVTWFDVSGGAFTAATAAGSQLLALNSVALGDNLRVSWTISGTTPSFTFEVQWLLRFAQ